GYSFQVKDEYANLMDEFLPVEMSAALIRTLSAIAIKQPIAQSEIIRVRGAGAYDHIRELVNRELVSKKDDQGGRSPMLTTTKKFQEYFRLTKDGKELRNFLKGAVKKAAEALEAAKNGQLAIPDMVSPETDEELNNRIFLETADMSMAESADSEGEFAPSATNATSADETFNVATAPAEAEAMQIAIELATTELFAETSAAKDVEAEAPLVAPAEPPVVTEVEAPVATEIEAPVATEVEAPAAAEVEAPVAAEVEAPVVTEVATPIAARAQINAAPEAEVDVPPPPVVEEPVRAKKARKTLSKLAKAADVENPQPLPEAEPLPEPPTGEKNADDDSVAAATTSPTKGSVQALQSTDGPKISSDDEPKKPSMLSDLLKKQKSLEESLKQGSDDEVEQTTIDFKSLVEPAPPADKTLPN
ncbi:MAG TPA: SMC-Scp complex subunit ScpB, partial [Candidatus Obscuribacterales bacterium]